MIVNRKQILPMDTGLRSNCLMCGSNVACRNPREMEAQKTLNEANRMVEIFSTAKRPLSERSLQALKMFQKCNLSRNIAEMEKKILAFVQTMCQIIPRKKATDRES
jgi:hypothetical protein